MQELCCYQKETVRKYCREQPLKAELYAFPGFAVGKGNLFEESSTGRIKTRSTCSQRSGSE